MPGSTIRRAKRSPSRKVATGLSRGSAERLEKILLVITQGDLGRTRAYLDRIRRARTTGNDDLDRALINLDEIALSARG